MALDTEERNHSKLKEKMKKERRGFLKKTAYAAPTIIVLGGLLKPRNANADFGGTPSDPQTTALERPSDNQIRR